MVVGGGPAGLMAARKAAEFDVSVLLLEKEHAFGKKACGEAVSASTLTDAEIRPSPRFISNDIRGAFVYAPDQRKHVEIIDQGYILKKEIFLSELASLAAKRGVEIWVGSQVLDVKGEAESYKITLKRLGEAISIKTRAVLGCDGVSSIVAKKFFERSNYKLIPCTQYKMVDCRFEDQHIVEVYLGNELAPLGYAWIFPKNKNTANVGIGVQKGSAKSYLDRFISSHPEKFENAKITSVQIAPVPIGGQIEKIVNGHVMVCGDAAGQVIPLTGGGIHSSIVAGKTAGEVAGEALSEGNISFQEYPKRYAPWSKRMRNSLKALRLVEKFTDREMNQLAEIFTGQDIVDVANGLNTRKVGTKLLKHPYFALRLGKALLGG